MKYLKVLSVLSVSFVIIYFFFYDNEDSLVSSVYNAPNRNDMNEYFSCPHLTPASYDSSYGINNARIAIVMAVAKASDYEEFVYAINATKCYAAHFGYQMHIIELYENHELEKNCNHTHVSAIYCYSSL